MNAKNTQEAIAAVEEAGKDARVSFQVGELLLLEEHCDGLLCTDRFPRSLFFFFVKYLWSKTLHYRVGCRCDGPVSQRHTRFPRHSRKIPGHGGVCVVCCAVAFLPPSNSMNFLLNALLLAVVRLCLFQLGLHDEMHKGQQNCASLFPPVQ